jgi:hypothetical protein
MPLMPRRESFGATASWKRISGAILNKVTSASIRESAPPVELDAKTIERHRRRDAACDWVQAHAALTRLVRDWAAAVTLKKEAGCCGHFEQRCTSIWASAAWPNRWPASSATNRTPRKKAAGGRSARGFAGALEGVRPGRARWCAVRELTRIAAPETEGVERYSPG